MRIIIGLGNPEPEYSKTRHNMGFDTINLVAQKNGIELTRSKCQSIFGTGMIQRRKSRFSLTTNFYEFKRGVHSKMARLR